MIKCWKDKTPINQLYGNPPENGEDWEEGYFVTREELFSAYIAGMVFQSQGGEFKFDDWLKQQLGKEK